MGDYAIGGIQAYNSNSYAGTGAFAVDGDSCGHRYAVGNTNPTNCNRINMYNLDFREKKNKISISIFSNKMGIGTPFYSQI